MSPPDSSPPTESARRLAARIASLPATLDHAVAALLHPGNRLTPLTPGDAPVWVTGGGMSEGPARYLVALLTERAIAAEYIPLSEFVAPEPGASSTVAADWPVARGTLIVFSQGLAPNARFPLLHAQRFRRCLLVTAVTPKPADSAMQSPDVSAIAAAAQARGVEVLTLPPSDEDGLLLRVVGPAVHALAAAWLAGCDPAWLRQVPTVYAAADDGLPPASLRQGDMLPKVALIASGRYASACFGLRWKLLEGLQQGDPPIWDLLQVAHGPLQSIWRRPQTLLVLKRQAATHEAALHAALSQVFQPPLHGIVTLTASRLPGLLAYFEHDAQLNACVLDGLTPRPGQPTIDLISWPGRGHDGPLYNLAPATTDLLRLGRSSDEPR